MIERAKDWNEAEGKKTKGKGEKKRKCACSMRQTNYAHSKLGLHAPGDGFQERLGRPQERKCPLPQQAEHRRRHPLSLKP